MLFFYLLVACAMNTLLRTVAWLAAFLGGAATAFAYGDPKETYAELESDHFIIHYPESRYAFALRAIAIAEEAHEALAPVFQTYSSEKTHIAVENHIDLANGWARVVYDNEIHLYPYPPYASEDLGNYSDWMRQLIYHEYTHILHMDTSDNAFYDVLNAIFGKFARGNGTLPRWFIEGLAVYFETKTSSGGRLRSERYQTMMRNAALEGRIPSLGGMSAQPVEWPGESSYYLFGAFFIQWLADQYGEGKIIEFIHAYSRQIVPYAMNRVAYRVYGKTFDELYDAWRQDEMRKAYQERIAFKKQWQATPAKQMVAPYRNAHPTARPHHHAFSFFQNDGAHRMGIALYDVDQKASTLLTECWTSCRSRWSQDGNTLYFDHTESKDGYVRINSLYDFDMATHAQRRLTRNISVRAFDVSATHLYVIAQNDEAVSVMRIPVAQIHADMTADEFETLYRGRDFEELEELHVLTGETPDEDRLAMTHFSLNKRAYNYRNGEWIAEEHHDLAHHVVTVYVKDIDAAGEWLQDDMAQTPLPTRDPEWIAVEGKVSLAYSAVAADGTLTRYIEDEDGTTRLVARRLEGIHSPTMLENGDLVFIQFTAYGMAVAKIDQQSLFSIEQMDGPRKTAWKHEVWDKALVIPEVQKRPYQPWRWMFPLFWTPSLAVTGDRVEIGLSLSGRDYLDHHNYTISSSYDFSLDALNFSISYIYGRLPWNLALYGGLQHSVSYWYDGKKNKEYEYQTASASLMTYRIWNGSYITQQLSFGMSVNHTQSSDRFSYPMYDPAAAPPRIPSLGWQNSLSVSYVLSNRRQYDKAVATSDGQYLRASLRFEAPWIGADAYALIASMDARFAWTLPWFETHAIGLSLSAGTSYVQDSNRTSFTLNTTVNTSLSLEDIIAFSSADALVHGYEPGIIRGQHYLYAHLDYHFGIYDPVLGSSTLPLGLQRISATLYGEWGYAWYQGEFDILKSKPAIGALLHFDITLGYRLVQRFSIGYAYGDMHQFYFGFF